MTPFLLIHTLPLIDGQKKKSAKMLTFCVAGTGFEPMTFGL